MFQQGRVFSDGMKARLLLDSSRPHPQMGSSAVHPALLPEASVGTSKLAEEVCPGNREGRCYVCEVGNQKEKEGLDPGSRERTNEEGKGS